MKLYDGGRAPNPRRVRIFLSEKGMSIPVEKIDLAALQHRSAEFTALNPLQRVFMEHHGLQCGFCTPGMIMAAVALAQTKGGNLDEHTIREGLEGNLCRCTGYHNIVAAVKAGAANMGAMHQAAE